MVIYGDWLLTFRTGGNRRANLKGGLYLILLPLFSCLYFIYI